MAPFQLQAAKPLSLGHLSRSQTAPKSIQNYGLLANFFPQAASCRE